MTSIEDIPAELRWEIAAKYATALPVVYDMIFRKALGAKYDAIELPIWIEGGKDAKKIADALRLPTETLKDLGDAYGIISTVLFGPELKWKMTEMGRDRLTTKVTGCPLLNRAVELGMNTALLLNACRAYNRSAVENLNPRYTWRSVKRMCTGDPHCENFIELRK